MLGDRADHEMETVPPLFVTSPEEMLPDPGGGELKQLCTKGTLHKSCLTLERERSDHRRAVIMKGRSHSSFHHKEHMLVHGQYQSLPFYQGKGDTSVGRMTPEAQAAADKHAVLLLPVSGHTLKS